MKNLFLFRRSDPDLRISDDDSTSSVKRFFVQFFEKKSKDEISFKHYAPQPQLSDKFDKFRPTMYRIDHPEEHVNDWVILPEPPPAPIGLNWPNVQVENNDENAGAIE